MSSMLRRPLLLLVGLVLSLTAASIPTAHAKKKVVVLPFTGFGGPMARNGVVQSLKREAALIPPEKFRATADQLSADTTQPDGIAAVCAKLHCDVVIAGEVSKQGRRFRVTVTVYNGGTGAVLGRRVAPARGLRNVGRAGGAAGRKAAPLVAKGQAGAAPGGSTPTPPPPPPPPAPENEEQATPHPQTDKPEDGEDTSDIPVFRSTKHKRRGAKDEDASMEEDTHAVASKRRKHESLFDIGVGVGGATRKCTVKGSDPAIPPGEYAPGLYPEFVLRAELYPLTPVVHNVFNGLGVGAGYSRHILITTTFRDKPEEKVKSSSQELLVDVLWRWFILSKPTSPMIKLLAGWGMRDFTLGNNEVLTSFNYQFFRVGLDGSVPLGTPVIALNVGFDVRPLMQVGQKAVDSYGSANGGLGYAIRGGVGGNIALSAGQIFYFADVEFLRFSAKFAGLDASLEDIAGIPNIHAPTTATDQFIRFWGGIGYSY